MSDCWNCPEYGTAYCDACRKELDAERAAYSDERGDWHRVIEAEYERTRGHV